jgi:hypothetical protein
MGYDKILVNVATYVIPCSVCVHQHSKCIPKQGHPLYVG